MLIKSGIYCIINLITNKLYVGSGINIKRRWYEHRTRLRFGNHHNSILQRAWNKYGEKNFKFQILEHVEWLDKLTERETFWINLTKCLDRNIGYNFCKEGKNNLGVKRSKETCLRISLGNKGKIRSPEALRNISLSLIGKKKSKSDLEKRKNTRMQKFASQLCSTPIIIE